MYFKAILCVVFVTGALSQDYSYSDADDQNLQEQQLAPNYARQSYDPSLYETARAEPYNFGFQSTDEYGTIMNRQETSDNSGAVRGSYGYTDPFGVFRQVDYVADEYGFRAEVKSNEPGMGTQSPANVQIYAEPPPAGVIVERGTYYHPHHHLLGNHIGSHHGSHSGNHHGNHIGNHVGQASQQQGTRRTVSGIGSQGSNGASRQARVGSSTNSRVPVPSTRTTVYIPPQQGAFSSNSIGTAQYPSTVSAQYAATYGTAGQYATSNQHASSNQQTTLNQHGTTTTTVYPYGYSGSQHRTVGSSGQKPVVAKPYDGPTYKVGNPHVVDLTKVEKDESGTVLLPTLLTTGGAPTLVKHIHTYPAPQINA